MNETNDWVQSLLAVQRIDMRLSKLRAQVESVQTDKAEADKLLRGDKARAEEAKKALLDLEMDLKNNEIEIQKLQASKNDFATKSSMVKKNDEYRAALHQIEQCDHKIAEFEAKEINILDAIEVAKLTLKEQERLLARTQKRVKQIHDDLDLREKNARAAGTKAKGERAPAFNKVKKDAAARYERLRKAGRARRPGQAVLVPIIEDVCGRCRMSTTAQITMNARKKQLVTCQNCGAMLYWND